MTRPWKLIIIFILHVLLAIIILGIIFCVWRLKESVTWCFAIAPALIGSFLCFHIACRENKRKKRVDEEDKLEEEIAKVLSSDHKIDALISLADRAHAETIRYREHVWKVVVWSVLLLGAALTAATLTAAKKYANMLNSILDLKEIYACFAVIVTVCGLRDVFFDYYWFVGQRNLQRKCERLLDFFKKDAYQQGKSLLPERYQIENYTLRDCVGHLIQWWFVIYAVSVYVIFSIFDA